MAGIKQVASKAGVSTATVSRVLSNPAKVSAQTRARVHLAIKELKYQPNQSAQILHSRRSRRLLVSTPTVTSIFISEVLESVHEAARKRGYNIILANSMNLAEREEEYAVMLQRGEVDGLLILGQIMSRTIISLSQDSEAKSPMVNGFGHDLDLNISTVQIDNVRASRDMADYLFGLGHRHIGIITGDDNIIRHDRVKGVQDACAVDPERRRYSLAEGDYGTESGFFACNELLSRTDPPTAIFCFSDDMAIGAIEALHRAGLRCPADVSVVGFDDIGIARHLYGGITSVHQPKELLGDTFVRVLVDLIEERADKQRLVLLDHSLVIRSTSGPPPS